MSVPQLVMARGIPTLPMTIKHIQTLDRFQIPSRCVANSISYSECSDISACFYLYSDAYRQLYMYFFSDHSLIWPYDYEGKFVCSY